MKEVFNPRVNMIHNEQVRRYECRDKNGKFTCDGGPSIIYEDGRWGFLHHHIGYHRIDGPANSSGEFWISGKLIGDKFVDFIKENDIDLNNLSDADKVLIALKFG